MRCTTIRTLLPLLGSLAVATGCVSATARFHAGPTITSDGTVDVRVGIAVGVGYSLTDESAVNGSAGAASGSGEVIELTSTIEYLEMPEDELGYRAGLHARASPASGNSGMYLHGGLLYPLLYKKSSSGHEKSFQTNSTRALTIGLRGRAGMAFRDDEQGDRQVSAALGGDLTIDWLMFSRMR